MARKYHPHNSPVINVDIEDVDTAKKAFSSIYALDTTMANG